MKMLLKRYAFAILATLLMLIASFGSVIAQEEVEAVEGSSSDGLMIAIIGIGALIVLGLGAAINAQNNDD